MKKIIFIALVLSGIGSAFAQQIIEYGNPRYLYPTLRPLLSQDLHGRIILSDVNSTTGKMATATFDMHDTVASMELREISSLTPAAMMGLKRLKWNTIQILS
ncbi:MAG: hypothetical protein K5650_03000 [Bacteroidales bacterium]|nr:hypothetical protein [Bacteroidales bacterium]